MLSEEVVRSTESNSSKVVHPVQLLAFICVDGSRGCSTLKKYCLNDAFYLPKDKSNHTLDPTTAKIKN